MAQARRLMKAWRKKRKVPKKKGKSGRKLVTYKADLEKCVSKLKDDPVLR